MSDAPPYVGLAPFGEGDADRFFGRDAERKRIIANLQASRLTLLYARSGVGKSSLLRAGVVARLAGTSRLDPFIFSSWSGDPNVELPRALGGGDDLEAALAQRAGDGTLLVILDQFEEFFEYHAGTDAGRRFADDLARCVARKDLRVRFLVSIREDAYSRLGDEFKGRLPNVYSNYLRLDDLDERGARAAVEEPLRVAGDASIEPALVDQVLSDVRRGANGDSRYETAHLQYVLRRLWDEEAAHGSRRLRLATLEGLGGSTAIFERHFDEAVGGLGAAEQDALARAFRYLVSASGTKRAESAADLAELAGVPVDVLERGLEHLREARVLTPVAADGQTRYELAHDLLAAPALEWRGERERARERAAQLRRFRRIVGALTVLAAVLGGLIVWALVERGAAAERAREARAQAAIAGSADALTVNPERSVQLARKAWALEPSPQAEGALRTALAASLVRARLDLGGTWRGTLSADGSVIATEGPDGVRAWRGLGGRAPMASLGAGDPFVSADGSMVASLGADGAELAGGARVPGARALGLSPDGQVAAVLVDDRLLRVDGRTGETTSAVDAGGLVSPALAFDSAQRVVVADCAGSARLLVWEAGRLRTLRASARDDVAIPRGNEARCLLAVSPDGRIAAQSDAGGSALLWDLERGRRLGADPARGVAVRDLAWDADGSRLALAAGKSAIVVDRSGRVRSQTPNQVDFVGGVAFDRTGELLVTAGRDGVARVWDTGSPHAGMVAELRGHTDEIADAAFTGDGRDVVTLSLDGSARKWEVVEGRVLRGSDWLLDAAVSPDGKRIATASVDGKALVTPLDGGRGVPIDHPLFPLQTVNAITFDPAGRRVAVAGAHDTQHGEILVAGAATGDLEHAVFPPGERTLSADFSPDGQWLVTTAVGAPAALWRLADYGPDALDSSAPTELLEVPRGRSAVRAQFSPDGRSVIVAANDGVARVFDVRTRAVTRELAAPGLMYGATFSGDGRRILTYGSDFRGRIWDARTGAKLAVLTGHSSWISSGAFSPDGRLVVTGSADQTTRVWAAGSGRLLSIQRRHGDTVNSVAFSPDGRTIVSAGDDRAVRIYRCATCEPVDALVARADSRIVSRGG